jgi:hypothetical protein
MSWYTWPTEAAFDTWHSAVKAGLNLPRVGVNQATGSPEPDKCQTTEYTAVTEVAADDWRASVEDDVAAAYTDGLGSVSEAPPVDEEALP